MSKNEHNDIAEHMFNVTQQKPEPGGFKVQKLNVRDEVVNHLKEKCREAFDNDQDVIKINMKKKDLGKMQLDNDMIDIREVSGRLIKVDNEMIIDLEFVTGDKKYKCMPSTCFFDGENVSIKHRELKL